MTPPSDQPTMMSSKQQQSEAQPSPPSTPLVYVVSESTILEFLEDERGFEAAMEAQFRRMDADGDQALSREELRQALLERLRLFESPLGMPDSWSRTPQELDRTYDALFRLFDSDGAGRVDLPKFLSQMREMSLAIARGLRGCPLQMLLDPGSFLHDAVQHEQRRLQSTRPAAT